jgi:hypothetical protein
MESETKKNGPRQPIKECHDCKQQQTYMSLCHVWTFVYCERKEDCNNPVLSDKDINELIAKGGKIKQ